jgi:hypothetical protein
MRRFKMLERPLRVQKDARRSNWILGCDPSDSADKCNPCPLQGVVSIRKPSHATHAGDHLAWNVFPCDKFRVRAFADPETGPFWTKPFPDTVNI